MGRATRDGARRRAAAWIAVAGVFVVLATATGVGFYATSAYVAALTGERGFSLATASSGPTLSFVLAGLGGVLAAWLLPRLGVRPLLLIGAAGSGIGLFLLGLAESPASLWLSFALTGGVGALMAVVPCTSLITRWFHPTPAKALTIATTGMSAGGAVVSPFVVLLIERYGLRTGTGLLAVLSVTVVTLVAVILREPRDGAAVPPAATQATAAARPATAMTVSMAAELAASPAGDEPPRPVWTFPVLSLAFGLLMLSQVGVVTHLLPIARDAGVGGAGFALTALAVSSVCARLLGIPLLSRFGLLRFSCAVAALQAAAMALIAVSGDLPVLVLSTALLGATVGNAVVLMPLHILAAYGLGRFDRLFARLNLVSTIGTAGGPLVLGLLHGAFAGYRVALLLLAAGSGIASALLFACHIDTRSSSQVSTSSREDRAASSG
ncbi:MFS transporter [Acrocarpospora sp. B8E8]|uniref:MFS transporter n=1 Tax=Acrocarpospora sp. B8E8 TaxID=3153572 RepID=UPI00325CF3E8